MIEVELPDGRVVEFPEGTSQDEMKGALGKLFAPTPATASDRVQAGVAGANRGVAGLLGAPIDAIQNVVDLGKAAVGVPYHEITGNPIPDALQVKDRANYVGSGDWIASKMDAALGDVTHPARPDDQGSRLAFAVGAGVPGVMASRDPSVMSNLYQTVVPSVAGQLVAENNPNNPSAAILANALTSMGPGLAKQGVYNAIAGDKQAMQQRIADADIAGAPLTLGQATGRPTLMGAENIVAASPINGALVRNAEAQQAGMQGRLNEIANTLDPNRPQQGTLANAGQLMQDTLGNQGTFKAANRAEETALGRIVDNAVGPYAGFRTPATMAEINGINNALPNDIPAIQELNRPAGIDPVIGPITEANNSPLGMTFAGMRRTRTNVGNDAFSGPNTVYNTQDQAALRLLYGGLSDDLAAAARASGAEPEWRQYNATVAHNRDLAEAVNQYIGDHITPEMAVRKAESDLQQNGSRFSQLAEALNKGSPEAYQALAGEVVSRMGRANPGQQGADADSFNLSTFLTNANKKRREDPQALENLFHEAGAGYTHGTQFEPLLRTADTIKDSAHWLKNPSGTSSAGAAIAGAAETANAVANHDPSVLAKLLGGMMGASGYGRKSVDQEFVRRVAASELPDQEKMALLVRALRANQAPSLTVQPP